MLRLSVLASAVLGLVLVGCEREDNSREGPGTTPTTQPQQPQQPQDPERSDRDRDRDREPLADVNVEITSDHKYNPAEVTVQVGQSIVWKNNDDEAHTVTCDPEKVENKDMVALPEGATPFDSGDIKAGDTFRMSFSVPGTYKYACLHHADHGLMGTIVVQPKSEMPKETPEGERP